MFWLALAFQVGLIVLLIVAWRREPEPKEPKE
jgi:hypothetical protein